MGALVALLASTSARAECPVLRGDAELVAEVRSALSLDAACGALEVTMARSPVGIVLRTSIAGQPTARVVEGAETAAVLIESWATAAAPMSEVAPETTTLPFDLGIRAEAAIGNDAAWMGGLGFELEKTLGAFTVGGDLRFGAGRLGSMGLEPDSTRLELDAALGGTLVFEAGPLLLGGGAWFGARWLHTEVDASAACAATDPCPLEGFLSNAMPSVDSIQPALELGLIARAPIESGVAFEARASIQLMPANPDGVLVRADRVVADDNFYVLRLGLGVRFGEDG